MEGVTKPVVDGECDPAVLTDVLAFLDGFHESASSECEAGAAATTGTLAPPSSSLSSDSTPATCSALLLGTRWRQTNALEENRPRVARYWRHKDELQSLRTVAEYLSNVLEFMKSGAHRPLRLEPTSDSGIVDWKQCAEQEMLLLERARRTNTDLRRLVRSEKHFASTIGSLLNSAWPHAWEIQQTIASLGPLGYQNSAATNSSSAWTTSFSIPSGDPSHLGTQWWLAVQNVSLPFNLGRDSFLLGQKKTARFEVQSLWTVRDDVYKEINFKGTVTFNISVSDTHWTLFTSANVSAGPDRKVLFQVTSVRTVTLSGSSCATACTFQANHQADELTEGAPSPSLGDTELHTKSAYIKEVGVSAWARAMRQKDERMRLLFEELGQVRV